jgi:hypothetical protein
VWQFVEIRMPSILRMKCCILADISAPVATLFLTLQRKTEATALVIHRFGLEVFADLLQVRRESWVDRNGVIVWGETMNGL